ncbi:MAG: HNH endonuclease, partial [Phycisphaerae bacterium]|nr:HNH endonuclease [Phycisphaerae bacterium]
MEAVALAKPSVLTSNVLVLNKFFMAVRIVNLRRALIMLFKQTAEVVSIDEDDKYSCYDFTSWAEISQYKRQFESAKHDWLHTVRFDLAVPRIVRLVSYGRTGGGSVRFNRRNIFARDSNRCQYCGRRFPTSELSLDHVIPRSRGGEATWENIVCSCLKCNVKKGG